MKIYERIIRSRGPHPLPQAEEPPMSSNARDYTAFVITDGWPQMGFILFCAAEGGQRRTHSFLYHNLDSIDLTQGKYGEYLRFTSRGKVVTLKGHGLMEMLFALRNHTLDAAYEFEQELYPALDPDEPAILEIRVTDLNASPTALS